MDKSKSKLLFVKSKKSIRRRSPLIQSGDRIDYKNLSLLFKLLTREGKILSRRVNKLTLKQQRLITIAIKQARLLSLLPFVNSPLFTFLKNEKKKMKKKNKKKKSESITRNPFRKKNIKKSESITRTPFRKKNIKKSESITRTPVRKKKI